MTHHIFARSRPRAVVSLLAAVLATLPVAVADEFRPAAGASPSLASTPPRSFDLAAVNSRDQKAYGHALPVTEVTDFTRMVDGKRVFSRTWLPSGTGPAERQGLGPLYNAASCIGCHFRDGRGAEQQSPPPLIYRLLTQRHQEPGDADEDRGTSGLPAHWGGQLQDHAVTADPEGQVTVTFEPIQGYYADGSDYTLRRPRYALAGYDPQTALRLGPRVPPTLVGIGLLAAVGEQTILAWADPLDANGDGISGRPNTLGTGSQRRLGRFGWKSEQPGLSEQVAGALAEDMGVVSFQHRTMDQAPEISRSDFASLLAYLHLLAPPAPRTDHPLFTRGEAIFKSAGCDGCHRPSLATVDAPDPASGADLPEPVLGRKIMPYTDLLLHDLGTELADGAGSTAVEREWRTAPLWGLGLMEVVNGQLLLLHDGRARSFEEAILWHGGEAEASREGFRHLSQADREALVAFLKSI